MGSYILYIVVLTVPVYSNQAGYWNLHFHYRLGYVKNLTLSPLFNIAREVGIIGFSLAYLSDVTQLRES